MHITGTEPAETTSLLHKTIKKVSEDIEGFKFNTAISALMILMNHVEKTGLTRDTHLALLRLLAPFAPHLTEELWYEAGNITSIHRAKFPIFDAALAKDETVTIGVQINGKHRGEITLSPTASEEEALISVKNNVIIQEKMANQSIKKVIYVAGKILNIIVE
jgi:leucyl-tRNA synthetase